MLRSPGLSDSAERGNVKNLWFHLMPYKDLPDDYRDTPPSVWVDINSKLLDAKRIHQHYNEYLLDQEN
ncbi:MAG: hypothetical protein CM1200mP9_04250 [Gammaproteobacteria bacterium]|nr:MAG: hypothetical protein CM1200mP9_04250 [Gammaproteobacteria bacterium]